MTAASRAPFFLRILLAVAFVLNSRVYSQFTPAEPPPMAPAEFAPDYVEETWKWSIRTDTLPGWLYSVEESTDLVNWTIVPNSYFYGDGTQLKCFICDGPPPPSQAAPTNGNGTGSGGWAWQVHHFSLTLRMQEAGASSSYFLQRESADPESPNAWQTNLTESLPAQVVGTRNFSMLEWADPTTHLVYWVDVHVIIGTDPPPTADPEHAPGVEGEADLTIYDHIKPQLLARLLTPAATTPPSNNPSISKFARIRRTDIDTNQNGLWDWWEWQFGYGPFAQLGQPGFASGEADDDGDGLNNSEEQAAGTDPTLTDSDADGIPDGDDTKPLEPVAPAVFATVTRTANYQYTGYPESANTPGTGTLSYSRDWEEPFSSSEPISTLLTAAEVGSSLAGYYAFPESLQEDPTLQELAEMGAAGSYTGAPSPASNGQAAYILPIDFIITASDDHKKAWFYRKAKVTVPYDETGVWLKIKTSKIGNAETVIQHVERISRTIPKDQFYSPSPIELRGTPPAPYGTQVWKEDLYTVDLDVDANMNGILLAPPGSTPVVQDDQGDERPYDLKGDANYTSLEESEASVIIRINNNNDSGPDKIDCEDDEILGNDLNELTQLPQIGDISRNHLTFSAPKLKDQSYKLKLTQGTDKIRVFYKQQQSTPRLVDETHTEETLDFSKFGQSTDPVVKEKFVMEGVRAGTAELELHLQGGEGGGETILDKVRVTVNVDRLPDDTANMAAVPLANSSARHRVAWTKDFNIAEMNEGAGGSSYGQVPTPPPTPYTGSDFYRALRGIMRLHLPALSQNNKLYPTATWDTTQVSSNKETASYWIGMNDPTNRTWIQWGFLIERDGNKKEFTEQMPQIYLESGAFGGQKFFNNLEKVPFKDSGVCKDVQATLRNGITLEFILYKLEDGATLDPWKLLLRNPAALGAIKAMSTGYPRDGGSPGNSLVNEALKNAYQVAEFRQLDMESEFTQSVTAVAGFPDAPFTVTNLRAGLRLGPGSAQTMPANIVSLWNWLSNGAFYWTPINAASGTSKITLLDGGGTLAVPSTIAAEHIGSGFDLHLQDFPWHVRAKAAGANESSAIEMWDARKWMFPSGTAKKWLPGK